ncbi:TolB family protein [Micromonospora orduensis]|uniref:TolB family protein n=1 Tax=Micromonospora orduensis TaxID=1420891 RepID=UPI0033D54C08
MNLGPFTRSAVRRPHALAGTAALLFLAFGAAACGAGAGPDVAAAPAESGTSAAAPGDTAPTGDSASTGDASAAGAGGSVPGADPAAAPTRPATGPTQWPQLTWYTAQQSGQKQNDPARIWRRTPAGKWQLVLSGRPGNGKVDSPLAVSPDGRRAAWVEASARRLVISGFDGTKQHVITTQGGWTCEPSWLDSRRVLYSLGRVDDWTLVAVNADGSGRKVLATHQAKCPAVSNGWIAQVADRTVSIRKEGGTTRSFTPRVPAGLVIGGVAAISGDGRTLVISTHTPTPGGCACGSRFRNYRVDAASGAATELVPLEGAWTKPTGHGEAIDAVILGDGGLVVQINADTPAGSAPDYRLVRYAANGRVLASAAVPAGQPWGGLLG